MLKKRLKIRLAMQCHLLCCPLCCNSYVFLYIKLPLDTFKFSFFTLSLFLACKITSGFATPTFRLHVTNIVFES